MAVVFPEEGSGEETENLWRVSGKKPEGREVEGIVSVPYSEAFKGQMVRRMIGPPKASANALARETSVSQATLCRWAQEARKAGKGVEAKSPLGEPRKWTVAEKVRVLALAEGLEGEALGALLRSEGLYEAQLETWRGALRSETDNAAVSRRETAEARRRVKQLERELMRKEKALAEAAALLILEKKLQVLDWGNEDGSTGQRRDG